MDYRPGDRVELVHTTDPYTALRPGATGTVQRYEVKCGHLRIQWDTGSALAMLVGEGDDVRLVAPVGKRPDTVEEPSP